MVRIAAWKNTPSRYVICADDHAMSTQLQERMAERCGSRQTILASHSPYISRPEEMADVILGASDAR
jgi:hypothetical protein